MCYSLQSRDLIADSIETVMGAQHYDANISIPGCDKNVSHRATSLLLHLILTSGLKSSFVGMVVVSEFFALQMPGTIMAMGRLNRPSIMVYGGTIKVMLLTPVFLLLNYLLYGLTTDVEMLFVSLICLISLYFVDVTPICYESKLFLRVH
jgi:hypothetical protein